MSAFTVDAMCYVITFKKTLSTQQTFKVLLSPERLGRKDVLGSVCIA